MNKIASGGRREAEGEKAEEKSNIRTPSSKGFTLIEVLLAMAILAVIMAVVYGSFSSASRNVEQAEAARDETDLARTLLAKMTDDITNAYYNRSMSPLNQNTNKNVNLTVFSGQKAEVGTGDDKVRHDSLALTTLTNWHRPGTTETELMETGYFFNEKPDGSGYSLFRREKRDLGPDTPPLEGGAEYELTDKVEALQFRYYDGTRSQWVDQWDASTGSTLNTLPQRVEVTLTLDSGNVYVTEAEVLNKAY